MLRTYIKYVAISLCLMLSFSVVIIPVRSAEIPCIWSGVETVVAVGDVHGDFEQFVLILKAAGVIDDTLHWIGGRTHLVQNGDILDRGPDSKKVMDLLMALEGQAHKAGGAVHPLIGNHEAMIMQNDFRYAHPGEIESHGGEEAYKKAMAPDGKYGRWISQHNAVIKINDTIFLHGGISPELSKIPIHQINARIRAELKQPEKKWDNSYIKSDNGPLWNRGWAQMSDEQVAQNLPKVLKNLQAKRMVIGHTVSKDGIMTRSDGKIVMIDVGLSKAYGGTPACLRIRGKTLEIVTLDSVVPLR